MRTDLLDAVSEMGLDESTVVFFSSDNGAEVLNSYVGSPRSYGTSWPYHGQKKQLLEVACRVTHPITPILIF